MRPKSTGKKLPPRMLQRNRKLKSGAIWIGYYYSGRDEAGRRKEFPLGTDLNEAKRKWAQLECKPIPTDATLMRFVFDRYIKDILPMKGVNTQRENNGSIKQLRLAFDGAPIDALTPQHIASYRDARTAKVRANREVTLLSHIFNMAREWGHTTNENPCRGIRKNKEKPRDFYADKAVWDAVYRHASVELQDAMDLNYLTGQRPADVLKMADQDINNSALLVRQAKTGKLLRIMLYQGEIKSELASVIERIQARPGRKCGSYLVSLSDGQQLNKWNLRLRFDTARKAAIDACKKEEQHVLAERIAQFQFRDIRAKSASEIVDAADASALLGHTEQDITDRVYRRVGQSVKPTR
jgi:integrase